MAVLHPSFVENLRLDTENERVWHGGRAVQLTPKAFALLRYLVERPGQLVTKEDLLNAVWPEVIVGESVLTTHVRAIRQALGDDAKAPHYIETVHRRGYRFIGKVVSSQHSVASSPLPQPTPDPRSPTPNTQHPTLPLVGRETDLAQLHQALDKALHGERQIVFVTGEPGIGKTTLVEAFVSEVWNQEKSQKSKRKSQKSKVKEGRRPSTQHPAPSP